MTDPFAKAGECITLSEAPLRRHVFSEIDIQAVTAAIGAQRPLLLLGEPGIGKSQLAEAAARKLGWHYVSKTVDALTEPADLLWTEDAVSRLAEAQLAAVSAHGDAEAVRTRLAREKFITPGVLWTAFDPADAAKAGGIPVTGAKGVVALIDEIDKAESAVPNGLLEALGARQFSAPGRDHAPVVAQNWPLILITSNEERPLPKAFIRRCIVHRMIAPAGDAFVDWLIERGAAYYPDKDHAEILEEVARTVAADRETARRARQLPLPGLAEFLDLLRALHADGQDPDLANARLRIEMIKSFFLQKGTPA